VTVLMQEIDGLAADQVSRRAEIDALCDGAAVLSHCGNRVAAVALLWAAVAIEPTDFVAHRRLAATLANAGDTATAAEEYVRYIEFSLKNDDVRRAAGELAYARATLGDVPQLYSAGRIMVPLSDIGHALVTPLYRAALEPTEAMRVSEKSFSPESSVETTPPLPNRGFAFDVTPRPTRLSRPSLLIAIWVFGILVLGALGTTALR
jgi:hypothetical protein